MSRVSKESHLCPRFKTGRRRTARAIRVSGRTAPNHPGRPTCTVEGLERRELFAAGPVLYAHENTPSTRRLYTVDVGTGATRTIGQTPQVMFDIAFSPGGTLFGIDSGNNLYRISTADAATTLVSNLGPIGEVPFGMVFSPSGKLLAAQKNLYEIDTATGKATRRGDLDGFTCAGDLAFDNRGRMFMSSTGNDLVRVDPATGQATRVGPMGFSQVLGLAYGPDNVM